jgi:hypothetical protein
VVTLGPKLPLNGVVLLETSSDFAIVEQALPQARFVTASVSVPARLLQTLRGGRLQVLLAPASDLPADAQVHLALGIAELDPQLAQFPLRTGAVADSATPAWLKAPAVGPRRTVPSHKNDTVDSYRVRVPLNSPAFILAKIDSKDATALAIYPTTNGEIGVGTDGCHTMWWAGAARGPVHVTLTAIGASGQSATAPGVPLRLRF